MDMNELLKMFKDPQALQRQAQEAQSRMASVTAIGSAGGGMVRVTLNGIMEMLAIEIAPEVIDPSDPLMLQDLVRAAHNDAAAHVREAMQAEVARTVGGAGLGSFGSGS
jgi:nucleoid-associated protein EbfC